MSNIDHQSVVGSNDAGVILRPNVRNQGHLEHISAPFAPTKIAWGQEARCTLPFQEPAGTHGVVDDLYLSFRIGLDAAGATLKDRYRSTWAREKIFFGFFFGFDLWGTHFGTPLWTPFWTPFWTRFGPILITLGDYRGHK